MKLRREPHAEHVKVTNARNNSSVTTDSESPGGADKLIHTSPRMSVQRKKLDGNFGQVAQRAEEAAETPNRTGLPDNLKSGVEQLSGIALDNVNVHFNSSKPSQLNAHAYAQGTDIHVGPGQEKHLPHETWHVVQQAQGRVQPTAQAHGVAINNDSGLEHEADVMGAKAMQLHRADPLPANNDRSMAGVIKPQGTTGHTQRAPRAPIQRVIKINGDLVEAKKVHDETIKSAGHPQLGRWLAERWVPDKEMHEFDSWDALWEAAFLEYLGDKGVRPGGSDPSGPEKSLPSRFKSFEKDDKKGQDKLIAHAKDSKHSWQILREMDAYVTIKEKLGADVNLPTPELVRLPGVADKPGALGIRMDRLAGNAIDLYKGHPRLILGKIAKTILRDEISAANIQAEKAAITKLREALTKLRERANATDTAISDLQGIVAPDGTFTLIDPLWAGSHKDKTAGEGPQFIKMNSTMDMVLGELKAVAGDPRKGLSKYLALAALPDAD